MLIAVYAHLRIWWSTSEKIWQKLTCPLPVTVGSVVEMPMNLEWNPGSWNDSSGNAHESWIFLITNNFLRVWPIKQFCINIHLASHLFITFQWFTFLLFLEQINCCKQKIVKFKASSLAYHINRVIHMGLPSFFDKIREYLWISLDWMYIFIMSMKLIWVH